MPTNPKASPTVSSTIGLKNLVIAPLTEDTEETLTYGELQLVAGAIEASVTPDNADPDIQYADDIEFDTLSRFLATRSTIMASSSAPRPTSPVISRSAS